MDALVERVLAAATAKRERLIEVTAGAVRIPSVSGEEEAIGRWFAEQASAVGLEVEAWEPDEDTVKAHRAYVPVEYGYAGRRNVEVIVRGDGSQDRRLILFGHTDTVPVDPNTTWEHDPWSGDVTEDRIFGRGSADMKAGCAVALVALEVLREEGITLGGDVVAHLIIDEEAGGNGTLDAVLAGRYPPGSGCIMLEPTTPDVMLISGRGAQFFRIRVVGEEGGTEYHRDAVSAIDPAIVLYEATKRFAQMREASVSHPLYDHEERVKVPTSITTINAGAWPSTTAGEAVLEGTIECLPGEDIHAVVDDYEAYLREVAADDPWLREHPFRFERFGLWFEAAELDPADDFVRSLRRASSRAIGREPAVVGGGGSDLRLPILYADCPTVLWGPGGGPIHSVDEWAAIDQLEEMLRACLVAAIEWCGPRKAADA